MALVKKKHIRHEYNLFSTHQDHQFGRGALASPKYWKGFDPDMIAKIISILAMLCKTDKKSHIIVSETEVHLIMELIVDRIISDKTRRVGNKHIKHLPRTLQTAKTDLEGHNWLQKLKFQDTSVAIYSHNRHTLYGIHRNS